jgi:hypothetical protein
VENIAALDFKNILKFMLDGHDFGPQHNFFYHAEATSFFWRVVEQGYRGRELALEGVI